MTAPIFDFNDHRGAIVREVVQRVASSTRDPLHALADAAYFETRRLARRFHERAAVAAGVAGQDRRAPSGQKPGRGGIFLRRAGIQNRKLLR